MCGGGTHGRWRAVQPLHHAHGHATLLRQGSQRSQSKFSISYYYSSSFPSPSLPSFAHWHRHANARACSWWWCPAADATVEYCAIVIVITYGHTCREEARSCTLHAQPAGDACMAGLCGREPLPLPRRRALRFCMRCERPRSTRRGRHKAACSSGADIARAPRRHHAPAPAPAPAH